ncbi:hypothetical protein [Methylomicrobium lacus]|uniref:hypothetical protein n=1 Tax=Methylomicrobium lacus TaxID=136992 RepID=UPI0035A95120
MRTKDSLLKAALLAAAAIAAAVPMPASAKGQDALLTTANPRVKEIIAVQDLVTDGLMATDGVLGTAVGLSPLGELALLVFVNSGRPNIADIVRAIPEYIKGVPVSVQATEPFRSMVRLIPGLNLPLGGSRVDHKAKQSLPIQLGTSGGWGDDQANGYCCGGTLGSLIQTGGNKYILSNYHVLRSDIVPGGNSIVATNGDAIVQPGLIDASCSANKTQNVAALAGSASLPDANVDAAIAQADSGAVRSDGAILEIGTLSASTITASINQAVKKSGRTTGLTRSKVSGLNATISVDYDSECAGGVAFTKTFTGQILIGNNLSKFLDSGDSGSLMVEDVTTNPRAVGLLFAGSSTIAVANPIGEVLGFFGAAMVGK